MVAIVGVLLGIALPSYEAYIERSNFTLAKADILEMSRELDDFFLEFKRYPDSLDDVGCGGMEDPWGNPYRYLNIAATLVEDKGKGKSKSKAKGKDKPRKDKNLHPINSDYDLYSIGPDGRSVLPLTAQPSRDDIIRANDGAFIGLAADY